MNVNIHKKIAHMSLTIQSFNEIKTAFDNIMKQIDIDENNCDLTDDEYDNFDWGIVSKYYTLRNFKKNYPSVPIWKSDGDGSIVVRIMTQNSTADNYVYINLSYQREPYGHLTDINYYTTADIVNCNTKKLYTKVNNFKYHDNVSSISYGDASGKRSVTFGNYTRPSLFINKISGLEQIAGALTITEHNFIDIYDISFREKKKLEEDEEDTLKIFVIIDNQIIERKHTDKGF